MSSFGPIYHLTCAALAAQHPIRLLPKQGESIEQSRYYPQMHERYGNAGFRVEHAVVVDDGVLQVVANADEGHIEWLWFRENGRVEYTRAGWCSVHAALLEALTYADEQT